MRDIGSNYNIVITIWSALYTECSNYILFVIHYCSWSMVFYVPRFKGQIGANYDAQQLSS